MESTGSSSSSSVAAAAAAAAVGTMFACAAFCCLASVAASIVVADSQTADAGVSESREYCAADEFRPACPDRDVIVITAATYGRMTFGACVKQDYGYLGCSQDVLDRMDGFCSGRRTCSVKLPDPSLEEVNTCPKEFKAYLNVSFKCVEVDSAACNGCIHPARVGSTGVAKLTRSRGFIASASTLDSPSGLCGSAQCPWYIEVQSGQTINLTLYDFSGKHAALPSPPPAMSGGFGPEPCTRLAVVKEAAHLRETPICYRQNRVQSVYSSVSQSIQIHVVSREVIRTKGPFLIHYEVIGCPDLHPPENAQLKRMGDTVIVECRDAAGHGLRWESRCVDSKWEGEIGTCPGSSLQTTLAPNFLTLPLGVLVSVVLGIALVIGVLIVTFGVVCLRRQQRDVNERTGNIIYLPPGQCYELREPTRHHHHPTGHSSASAATSGGRKVTVRSSASACSVQSAGCKDRRLPPGGGRRNVYAHNARMESRPLPSIPDISAASCSSSSIGGEQGPCCRGPHRGDQIELGPCPHHHHLRASTMGRNASSSQKAARTRRTRAGSGGGGCGPQPNVPSFSGFAAVAGTHGGPSNPSTVPQHYTVLDPIEVQQQLTETLLAPGRTAAASTTSPRRGTNASSATAAADQGTYDSGASPGQPPPPKPPLLPSMEGASGAASRGRCGDGGIEKSSCREITLRPTRQRTNFDSAVSNSGGNSSWP